MSPSLTTLKLNTAAPARLRKPWEVIDQEILEHLTMEMVFGDLHKLRRDGKHYQACCPIHRGKEGDAFSLDPERLEWICFLGCGGGGPVQFLQKTQRLTWMESAQALAVMAGVDPAKFHVWGQHWTDQDFERHEQLERRSSLLRIFMAFSRTLLMSAAGRSLRGYLDQHFGLSESVLPDLELGLYTTSADVFHYLKRTGQDLQELRGRGLFEPRWTGRVVAPWMDGSGRIVNLWSWESGKLSRDPGEPIGEPLFDRDPLGAQQTPFFLHQALSAEKYDLILLDEPLYALLARGIGLEDPFPVATWGRLTNEQVDLLEQTLRRDGSLTLLSSYHPDSYGTKSDATFQNLKLLQEADFPVYVVDSKRLAEDEKRHASPETFLKKHGGTDFRRLLKQAEVMVAPQRSAARESSLLPALSRIFGSKPAAEDAVAAEFGQSRGSQVPLIGLLLGAAEEIGQRLARGFLKALPADQQILTGSGAPALPAPDTPPQLPAASEESPPPVFSVDRLEQASWVTSTAKPSGWKELDALGVRFRPGELVMLGGAPRHGRTSFVVGLLVYWLYSTEESFVLFTYDESEVQIYHRLLSLLTAMAGEGWPLQRVRNHLSNRSQRAADITLAQVEVLETARECLRGWETRLHVVFRPNWSLAEIESHIRTVSDGAPLGGVLIDPADQLFAQDGGLPRLPASRWLKSLAVEFACPVVASLRLKDRTGEAEWDTLEGGRPQLGDFPEGLDQEADLMMGLFNHLAAPGASRGTAPASTPLEVGLLKNRSGETGPWVRLAFERDYCLLQD